MKLFPFKIKSVNAVELADRRSCINSPSKLLLVNCIVLSEGFCRSRYSGNLPVNSWLFKTKCSNVDRSDQSGNGPEIGPLDIMNTASLGKNDNSYGKVPLILFDFSPFVAENTVDYMSCIENVLDMISLP